MKSFKTLKKEAEMEKKSSPYSLFIQNIEEAIKTMIKNGCKELEALVPEMFAREFATEAVEAGFKVSFRKNFFNAATNDQSSFYVISWKENVFYKGYDEKDKDAK